MNIAVCDENENARNELTKAIEEYYHQKALKAKIFQFSCGELLLKSNQSFDVIFTEIKTGEPGEMDTCKELKRENPYIPIILVSASDEFLDYAFKLPAFRFLSKPLNISKLYSALDDATELFKNEVIIFYDALTCTNIKLNANDIIFLEVDNRKTKIVTVYGTYCSNQKISYWKNKIKSINFICPHSSYLTNLNYAVSYNRKKLVLAKKNEKGRIERLYEISIAPKKQTEIKKQLFNIIGNR